MPRDLLLSLLATASGDGLLAIDAERLAVWAADPVRAAAEGEQRSAGAIAILALQGPLTPRGLSFWGRTIAPGMDAFRAAGARAAADPNIAAIVLDVNSPGGTYAGTPETANAVREWAAVKPVVAVVDSMAASAAYYIASQATEIAVTPSGEVGSIGVLATHIEFSKALENDGVAVTIIRSRPGKADANPFEPLSDAAKAAIKVSVEEADGEFLKAVAKGRGRTAAQIRALADSEAVRLVGARRAVELGLADKVATMNEVLAGMVRTRPPARRRSALAFA